MCLIFCLDLLRSLLCDNRKRILITGFGGIYKDLPNPSWEGVKILDKDYIEDKHNVILSKQEIAVRYADVDQIVPKLWLDISCRPDLAIHVGAASGNCFKLETTAHKSGYTICDDDGKLPKYNQNVCSGPPDHKTPLDVEAICKEFTRDPPGDNLKAIVSNDAKRWLCEYIYYTSLCHGTTLFVHVPAEEYTKEQIAQGLTRILELCLKQQLMMDNPS